VVGEDLRSRLGEGVTERLDLGNEIDGAPGDDLVEEQGGVGRIGDGVDVADRFLSVNRPS